MIALTGCTTEPSTPFQPATYVLQSVGELALPATYSSVTYADREERIVYIYDTVTIVSDTQFLRSFQVIYLSAQDTRVDTTARQSASHPGIILDRDGAIILLPQDDLGQNVETIELLPAGPNLRRRMRNSAQRCDATQFPQPLCETLRDELVDAVYVRR